MRAKLASVASALVAAASVALLGCPAALDDPGRFTATGAKADTTPASTSPPPTCDAPSVFAAHCTSCHAGASPSGNLALDQNLDGLEGKAAAGGSGELIDLANPTASVVYTKMTTPAYGTVMPPSGALGATDTDCVRTWLVALAAADGGI